MEGQVAGGEASVAILRRFLFKPANFSWVIEGKLAGSARPETEQQLHWLRDKGIEAIVCLNMERPLNEQKMKDLGFECVSIPVKDFTAPKLEDMERFVSFSNEMIEQGKPVLVCCGAGIGRTGTMLAAYFVSLCSSPEQALAQVKEKRGMEVESTAQKEAVYEFARKMGKCQKQLV